ncbi:MAG: hypothetical protein QNJ87_12725 [Gammaproteobacteria bacterium]|nr:hypothetical protein [Gammaproteobacteria bacterium]
MAVPQLDSVETLRGLVAFYVEAHNTELPHWAFHGQRPNEMFYGQGKGVPEKLTREDSGAGRPTDREPGEVM